MKNFKPIIDHQGEVKPLTDDDLNHFKPAHEVLPQSFLENSKAKGRGLQKSPKKIPITIRLSPEVIEYFKETGKGWQTRVDDALKSTIEKRH